MRLLIIGADAAGMAAAHQSLRTARRTGRDLEVVAVDAGHHTSYSQCGVPYWVAGDVASESALVARTADQHRSSGIDLRLGHRATELDLDRRVARVRSDDGSESEIGFDEVLLATGGEPVLPPWSRGSDGKVLPRMHPMKTLQDGQFWRRVADQRPRNALVVGGGYIGVEAAEALARRGLSTTLLTRREPMAATLVPEQAAHVRRGLQEIGASVVGGAEVVAAESDGEDYLLTTASGEQYRGDAVVLALGVSPRTELAVGAGLPVADPATAPWARQALVPDATGRLADGVWAAGDNCAIYDFLVRQASYLPLGTHANKLGRVAGTNLGGGRARFPGAVGTAITRAGQVEVSRTGLQPEWAEQLGYADPITATLDATTAAGYMPEAQPMHLWALGDRESGRLLGLQITGGQGAGKRIDAVAAALMTGLTCEQFAYLDLAYAPPFSPAWEPVQIVVRKLAEG